MSAQASPKQRSLMVLREAERLVLLLPWVSYKNIVLHLLIIELSNHNSLGKELDNEAFFTMSINTAPKKVATITGHSAAVCYRKVALEGDPMMYEKIANYPANVISRTYSWRVTGFNKQLLTMTGYTEHPSTVPPGSWHELWASEQRWDIGKRVLQYLISH